MIIYFCIIIFISGTFVQTSLSLQHTHQHLPIQIGLTNNRFFLWSQPNQDAPDEGYPVILLFHGAGQHAFSWILGWNQWNKAQKTFPQVALCQGYLIVYLESQRPIRPGPRAWDVFTIQATENKDIIYVQSIIDYLESLPINIDTNNLFCAGFSSGAFMCSRLALNCGELFSAVALNSGCNADRIILTNRGPVFNFSKTVDTPTSHPPTLLLHGTTDQLVPIGCSTQYQSDLHEVNIPCMLIIDPTQGHIWLSSQNNQILQFFDQYATT